MWFLFFNLVFTSFINVWNSCQVGSIRYYTYWVQWTSWWWAATVHRDTTHWAQSSNRCRVPLEIRVTSVESGHSSPESAAPSNLHAMAAYGGVRWQSRRRSIQWVVVVGGWSTVVYRRRVGRREVVLNRCQCWLCSCHQMLEILMSDYRHYLLYYINLITINLVTVFLMWVTRSPY
jgi:hypothetical protein